ncbi:MAG: AI-2E family transporter [Pseudomonadota bacterium]|jgi:predicted PurR-regulated permease PerM
MTSSHFFTIIKPAGLATLLLLVAGLWVLHSFILPIAWAAVLAFAVWPLYEHLYRRTPCGIRGGWLPLGMTLLMMVLLMIPATFGVVVLGHEVQMLHHLLVKVQSSGIGAPEWLIQLPWVGGWVQETWSETFGNPETIKNALNALGMGAVFTYTRDLAAQVLHHFMSGFITLLALFFIFRDGHGLGRQILDRSISLFGAAGARYARHAVTAVRGTVNGMLLVGIGKGVILGLGYWAVGLSQPVLLGTLTAVVALVPFAAKLVFGAASIYLIVQGHAAAGIILAVYGFIITLIADNYVRPALIGGAANIPFLPTLLGIFGGVEAMGFVGLFIGPTVMAILISLWRDWNDETRLSAD